MKSHVSITVPFSGNVDFDLQITKSTDIPRQNNETGYCKSQIFFCSSNSGETRPTRYSTLSHDSGVGSDYMVSPSWTDYSESSVQSIKTVSHKSQNFHIKEVEETPLQNNLSETTLPIIQTIPRVLDKSKEKSNHFSAALQVPKLCETTVKSKNGEDSEKYVDKHAINELKFCENGRTVDNKQTISLDSFEVFDEVKMHTPSISTFTLLQSVNRKDEEIRKALSTEVCDKLCKAKKVDITAHPEIQVFSYENISYISKNLLDNATLTSDTSLLRLGKSEVPQATNKSCYATKCYEDSTKNALVEAYPGMSGLVCCCQQPNIERSDKQTSISKEPHMLEQESLSSDTVPEDIVQLCESHKMATKPEPANFSSVHECVSLGKQEDSGHNLLVNRNSYISEKSKLSSNCNLWHHADQYETYLNKITLQPRQMLGSESSFYASKECSNFDSVHPIDVEVPSFVDSSTLKCTAVSFCHNCLDSDCTKDNSIKEIKSIVADGYQAYLDKLSLKPIFSIVK